MNNTSDREVAVFNAALQLTVEQRAAYLDKTCAGDDDLRRRLEGLLRVHDEVGTFLVNPTQESVPAAASRGASGNIRLGVSSIEKTGDRIGRYKLLQQIGEGGCGVVYLAEQTEPVRRKVAVKVIKLGMDTKHVIARFEAERQALALMDHPNIAKVLDAGATETGRPFFAMELVRGIKITDYCDENHLTTEQRLKLFTQICQAIQHAHQKGIIHRDIKPSNILVADHDGVPVPKVIDFGIAKATTDQRLTDKTLFTALEQFMGTPAYMSPEQAKLSGLDIDTRTDIYSLGVLLYELLTGKTPFDAKELLSAGLEEMRRTICDREPTRPSTALSTMIAADLTTAAIRRRSDAPELIHRVSGDLDWIVMKALEKDRKRRYETANDLSLDVQRHLDNEPVAARPPSNAYRFQKLVHRNKLMVIAVGVVAGVLVMGAVVSVGQAVRATRAEREQVHLREEAERSRKNEATLRTQAEAEARKARTEAAKSEQVARFLKDMLGGAGPGVALGQDTTLLRGILDRTTERVNNDLTNQPEVQVELLNICGQVYHGIGEDAKAEAVFRQALVIEQKLPGNFLPDVAGSLFGLAEVLQAEERPAESEAFFRQSLEVRRKVYGNENPEVAACLNNLTGPLLAQGKLAEAEIFAREALAMKRKSVPNDDLEVAVSLRDLGLVLRAAGKLDEAEKLLREGLETFKNRYGEVHPQVAFTLNGLASVLSDEGRLAEAEAAFREALAIQRKIYDSGNFRVARTLRRLNAVLQKEGKPAEAQDLIQTKSAAVGQPKKSE